MPFLETNNSICPYCKKDWVEGFAEERIQFSIFNIVETTYFTYFKGKVECPHCKKVFVLTKTVTKDLRDDTQHDGEHEEKDGWK